MNIHSKKKEQFYQILKEERIYPVFQPIVSLKNGEVFGYEALTRLDIENCLTNIEEFFLLAEKLECLWKVEELCRRKALLAVKKNGTEKKIFLNVDPNIIKDPLFRKGVTISYLKEFNLYPDNIIFEITERNSIDDEISFRNTIQHYQEQNFEIAIDDFGNGYAGMNRVCKLNPEYIKIDREIIHDIDKDALKATIVESMAQFCRKSHIQLIAEGIETREELYTLINLGVNYGQGYYLKRPDKEIAPISGYIATEIRTQYDKTVIFNPHQSVFGNIGEICRKGKTVSGKTSGKSVYDYFCNHPSITEIIVLDKNNMVDGILTREHTMNAFGGMYGYSLATRKTASELMITNPLVVDYSEAIDEVSRRALMRSQKMLYTAVVVTENETYYGIVTIKDLLESAISIQVHRAVETNPLTGLPGNTIIDTHIEEFLNNKQAFSIAYIDMDNFKAYNDAYGFNNGDLMIQTLAESIRKYCINGEFIGHIGGDDFVLMKASSEILPLLKQISKDFKCQIKKLYNAEDYDRGYIISKNRHDKTEKFPLVTISMAVICIKAEHKLNEKTFSKMLVKAKKKSKAKDGNSYYCINV